jgi:hypothetical protein
MTHEIPPSTVDRIFYFNANINVRANSANDTLFRCRIFETSTSAEVAVAYVQRLYWSTGALQGYSNVPIQGLHYIPAGQTYSYAVQVVGTGASFGGHVGGGGATHNSLLIMRMGGDISDFTD